MRHEFCQPLVMQLGRKLGLFAVKVGSVHSHYVHQHSPLNSAHSRLPTPQSLAGFALGLTAGELWAMRVESAFMFPSTRAPAYTTSSEPLSIRNSCLEIGRPRKPLGPKLYGERHIHS